MLAKRIIPTMLVRGRQLVKGQRFDAWRSIGHAAQAARVHAMRGVDELCILDIMATKEGRGPDLDLVSELAESVFIPITVGGGVRTVDDIARLLQAGADKVCIGTWAIEEDGLMDAASDRFGAQALVLSIDYKRLAYSCCDDGHDTVMTRCGKQPWMSRVSGCHDQGDLTFEPTLPLKFAEAADGVAGEILLQSIDRDGTLTGYDLDLIRSVSDAVGIPVIASGGCGSPEHMHEALQAGADAVAAGAMFAFTDETPRSCAHYLQARGWPIRLPSSSS